MLIGVIIGIVLYAANLRHFSIDAHLFFFYMIPPIILDAGFFIPNRTFFDNIGTILLYAIVGTILNTFLLGFSLWGVSLTSAMPFRLDVMQILTFAALMSAVDPMSVLAIFDDAHVTECLYIIVFGESLVNNGIAVVCCMNMSFSYDKQYLPVVRNLH
ncbi:hypothetical protein LSH36_101g05069 [Paralvinella palmiformis]|uniref:Cation/H+ exchanger transmembrane domain-containing protein n=1 Tax=Paralvinella palmiformis TaxID=53620 RepID=A0AAD9JZR8_9ANNE|nr:hypothetical protein LSH36_101g05069 [Paralvinella palmiformis]